MAHVSFWSRLCLLGLLCLALEAKIESHPVTNNNDNNGINHRLEDSFQPSHASVLFNNKNRQSLRRTQRRLQDDPVEKDGENSVTPGENIEENPPKKVFTQEATLSLSQRNQKQPSQEPPISTDSSSIMTTAVNFTAVSLTACQQIDLAVSFMTSLDWDASLWRNVSATTAGTKGNRKQQKRKDSSFYYYCWDVYLLQIILIPLSLAMALFGSQLLVPTCCLAAALLAVACVFHLVQVATSHSSPRWYHNLDVDCPMKLALSVVAASISAFVASTFVRFGLFSLGALAAGGGAYLVLDAFPFLDPTHDAAGTVDRTYDAITVALQQNTLHGMTNHQDSELSPFGWIVTVCMGLFGGIILRWYEQASLEIVTSFMGGVGCAYSLHTFVIVQGGHIHRSVVFLVACAMGVFGWRFQRSRRLRYDLYAHKKSYDEGSRQAQPPPQPYTYAPVPTQVTQTPVIHVPPPPAQQPLQQQQPPAASIDQLQDTLSSLNGLLQRPNTAATLQHQPQQQAPSSEQITELTQSLNMLLRRMDTTGNSNISGNDSSTSKQQ